MRMPIITVEEECQYFDTDSNEKNQCLKPVYQTKFPQKYLFLYVIGSHHWSEKPT
jgi:hypothetical protein